MPFIPHTQEDKDNILKTINEKNIDALFSEIPESLISSFPRRRESTYKDNQVDCCATGVSRLRGNDVAPGNDELDYGLTEQEITHFMQKKSQEDFCELNFIGAGAYEHFIPAAVWQLATRGEFITAYTPYQPEASQCGLQVIYEYQSMMSNILDMDASNASLYDGSSALAEAVLMAVRCNKKVKNKTILIPQNIHPSYIKTIEAIISVQNINIEYLNFDATSGTIEFENLKIHQDFTALIIPQPNFFGSLEDIDLLTNYAHENNALVIAVVNPIAMNLLKPPGQWGTGGADIACGEGQPLGAPISSGGPYFGFLCCKQQHIRQLPGRIVGKTVDRNKKNGFVLTLQAREQHIRRNKATSNICTNQGLMVTAATIFMTLMGPHGLKNIAIKSVNNLNLLLNKLAELKNIKIKFNSHNFHEAVIELPCEAKKIIDKFSEHKINAGFDLGVFYPELKNCLLICVTETKTEEDLEKYKNLLTDIL